MGTLHVHTLNVQHSLMQMCACECILVYTPHAPTYTCTCVHRMSHTYYNTHSCPQDGFYTHMHIHMYSHTHTTTCTHASTHIHTCSIHTRMYIHMHTHSHMYTRVCPRPHAQIQQGSMFFIPPIKIHRCNICRLYQECFFAGLVCI